MNISEVINDIKLSESLNTIALPFKEPTEIVIKEILEMSIREFSRFKPCTKEGYEMRKNLRSPDEMSKKIGIYFLPEKLTTTKVKEASAYIASSELQEKEASTNAFTVGSPFVGFGSYYPQDIIDATMTGAAINKYAGITSKPATSKWLGYNKIQLFDFPANACVKFVVTCEHDLNGETIPESCVSSFMQLATLDVQRTLYKAIKNMTNVGSAFKEIQLKIDDWAGAADKRDQLIKEWTDSYHLDDTDLVQFF